MRLLPPVLVLMLLAVMSLLRLILPGPVFAPSPWNWLGILPAVGGLWLAIAGSRLFERLETNIRTFDDPTILVTDGLFRYSRNPMYLGFTLFLLGIGIVFGTLYPLIAGASFWIIADRWYVPFEERAMTRRFGDAYERYRRSVRRWL